MTDPPQGGLPLGGQSPRNDAEFLHTGRLSSPSASFSHSNSWVTFRLCQKQVTWRFSRQEAQSSSPKPPVRFAESGDPDCKCSLPGQHLLQRAQGPPTRGCSAPTPPSRVPAPLPVTRPPSTPPHRPPHLICTEVCGNRDPRAGTHGRPGGPTRPRGSVSAPTRGRGLPRVGRGPLMVQGSRSETKDSAPQPALGPALPSVSPSVKWASEHSVPGRPELCTKQMWFSNCVQSAPRISHCGWHPPCVSQDLGSSCTS